MRLYSILFNFIQFYSISCCRIINPQLILNDPIFFKHCGCNCFIVFHLIYPMISFTPWSHPQSVFTPKVSYDHPKNIMITWSHGEGFKGFEATEVRLRFRRLPDAFRKLKFFLQHFCEFIKQETWVYKYFLSAQNAHTRVKHTA